MVDKIRIPPAVARHLGYYVYLYLDPRVGRPFYVGKGKGSRLLAHLSEEAESRKAATIKELTRAGFRPELQVLAHALPNSTTARNGNRYLNRSGRW